MFTDQVITSRKTQNKINSEDPESPDILQVLPTGLEFKSWKCKDRFLKSVVTYLPDFPKELELSSC